MCSITLFEIRASSSLIITVLYYQAFIIVTNMNAILRYLQ
jgi:hypothetical protein